VWTPFVKRLKKMDSNCLKPFLGIKMALKKRLKTAIFLY
jgi:hypothetical protein